MSHSSRRTALRFIGLPTPTTLRALLSRLRVSNMRDAILGITLRTKFKILRSKLRQNTRWSILVSFLTRLPALTRDEARRIAANSPTCRSYLRAVEAAVSALGHKRTFLDISAMSALPPIADIAELEEHVR